MKKDRTVENFVASLTSIFGFILILFLYSWSSTVYNDTLITFRVLFLISLLISIPFWIWIYKKGFEGLSKNIGLLVIIIGSTLFASGLLFLSINYIPIGDSVQQKCKILDAYQLKIKGEKRKYIKIEWKREVIELPIFSSEYYGKKKIILETQRGLLGFDIIKNRKLE